MLQVVLETEPMPASTRLNSASNLGDAFPNTDLRLDASGIDFGNTSDWILDDFWHFNDFPTLPFNG